MNSINMRSSKMKFLVYGFVICGLFLTIYLLSNTHSKLKTVKGAYDVCLQQKDSLLAQLQVVYEQKSRVEKSLQKEKLDHKKTKDDFQDNIRAKLDVDKEKKDAEGRYSSLQQEHQSLQDKYTQLKEKSNQLEENFHKYQEEAENLGQNKENEIKNLNGKLSGLVLSNEQLKQNYDTQAKDLAQITEKLSSLQLLNAQLLHKAQQPSEIVVKESNSVSNQVPESNVENVPVNKQPNQGNAEAENVKTISDGVGGGLNDVPSAGNGANLNIPQSNLTNIGGDGVKSGGGNEGEGGLVNKNPVNKNEKVETNDVNEVEESKMQVQQPDNQKNLGQTLSKPKGVVSSTMKNADNQVPIPKPRSENSVKEDENQFLPQPNKVIQQNQVRIEHGDEDGEPALPQKEANGMGRWEGNLKRGPQLSPLAGQQVNHPNEEDDYRGEEGGDDDAAEEDAGDEGFPAGDNKQRKRFQDHDFEDEADQNHAKEEGHEGVVVQPK